MQLSILARCQVARSQRSGQKQPLRPRPGAFLVFEASDVSRYFTSHPVLLTLCQVPEEAEDERQQVPETQKAMAVASLQKLFFEELSSSEDRNAAAASALRRLAEPLTCP